MTVQELIEQLQELPPDARVYRTDGEYSGSTSPVREVHYQKGATLRGEANTVVLI